MAIKIGHASIDENGRVSGGKAGDQTGKEICIRDWYSKPWNVMLICTDKAIAKQAAAYMKAICDDDDFGYDQSQRGTGYLAIVAAGGKVEKATPSEFDCSSLVASCYKLAGLNINYQCTTRNLRAALLATGKFKAYTDSAHIGTDAYAEVGAIYLSEGHHVVMALGSGSKASTPVQPATTVSDVPKTIWNFLKAKGYNNTATAGIMGNLYAESGLAANNLQNTGNTKLNMTDAQYTSAVDNGTYCNFVKDSHGYGLAQWTYWSRKQNLLNYAKSKNKSIGDLTMQLEFLVQELNGLKTELNAAGSVKKASDIILTKFERPADQSDNAKAKRASYGQKYYDQYAENKTPAPTPQPKPVQPSKPTFVVGKVYTLQVELKVRTGAGTGNTAKTHNQLTPDGRKHDADKDGALDKGTQVTCLEVKTIGSDIWIKAPSGWMAAYYHGEIYIK